MSNIAVKLDSISLFLGEDSLDRHIKLSDCFVENQIQFKPTALDENKLLLSPSLWGMPEIFRKKMIANSYYTLNDISEINRLADIVRYNFSDGSQISAKEILRHPYHRLIHLSMLPAKTEAGQSPFENWTLIQKYNPGVLKKEVYEVEKIIQELIKKLINKKAELNIYLQSEQAHSRYIQINEFNYQPQDLINWKFSLISSDPFEVKLSLESPQNNEIVYFHSYGIDVQNKRVLIYSFFKDYKKISSLAERTQLITPISVFKFNIADKIIFKEILTYLRGTALVVKSNQEVQKITAEESYGYIDINTQCEFSISHKAELKKEIIEIPGPSDRLSFYLQVLNEGILFFNDSANEVLSFSSRVRREWDVKLLKHMGIIQYITFEALLLHFEGALSSGEVCSKEEFFNKIKKQIHLILTAGSEAVFHENSTIDELCSASIVNIFDIYTKKVLHDLNTNEIELHLTEYREYHVEGLFNREMYLLLTLLKNLALETEGETFKRSRVGMLNKITNYTKTDKPFNFKDNRFVISQQKAESNQKLIDTFKVLQRLTLNNYKLAYNGNLLSQLNDTDFKVNFNVKNSESHADLNWFELDPKIFLLGEEIPIETFRKFGTSGVVEYRGRLYLLPEQHMPSIRRLEKFWQKLQKAKDRLGNGKKGQNIFFLEKNQTLELLFLRHSGVEVQGDEQWNKVCDYYDNLGKSSNELKIPSSIKAELKDYQKSGLNWLYDLYKLRLGALLADDMGLGKTIQTLAFLETLRKKEELGLVLILVPSSLVYNWQSEIEKFTPELPFVVFNNKDKAKIAENLEQKQAKVVIATYGLLMEHQEVLAKIKWQILILDEAQNIKNIAAKRTGAVRSLKASYKIALTGTPMENHYGEFYSLMDVVVPGCLGELEDFRRDYVNRENIDKDLLNDLKIKTKPLILRRTKAEILDQLPSKEESVVTISFDDRQKEIYRDIAVAYNTEIQQALTAETSGQISSGAGTGSVQIKMLTALLRLRQVCSDPAALPDVKYNRVPPKIETLVETVSEIVENKDSVLVFTQFIQTLNHIEKKLKQEGIKTFVLHGAISSVQRQKILKDFNNYDGGAALIMTLKTGGVGLNLTKASYVFHIEPWWNPAVENQATDRAHRLGQNKAVQVFKYIMHDSLEEKIQVLKDRKDKKFQALLDPDEAGSITHTKSSISKEDFDMLLGVK